MLTIKTMFDLVMPELTLPKNKEMLGDFIRVTSSDKEARLATYMLAKYFMREVKIDSVLFPHARCPKYDDNECFAYLLTLEKSQIEMKSVAIGALCFRLRDFGYGLQWVWFHPYVRNEGFLKRNWPLLEEKFGKDFYCEPPYTPAMEVFLVKNKYHSHMKHKCFKNVPMWYDKLTGATK